MIHELPYVCFFRPNESFGLWLRRRGYRRVLEAGAGVGLLVSMFPFVLGIDMFRRENARSHVVIADALEFDVSTFDAVIIARPSHGDWSGDLARKVIGLGIDIVYVTVPGNMKFDPVELGMKEMLKDAGEDGESVWMWTRCPGMLDVEKWFLVRSLESGDVDPTLKRWTTDWVTKSGDKWENCFGGWFYRESTDEIMEERVVVSAQELDWTKTGLVGDHFSTGWCSPDGMWVGCDDRHHDRVADLHLKSDTRELENRGWCRVSKPVDWIEGDTGVQCMRNLTQEQRDTLSRRGVDLVAVDRRMAGRLPTGEILIPPHDSDGFGFL